MNENNARERGYSYTGISDWRREDVKERLAGLREKGYKALFVTTPPNPLSRGSHGSMYSVYAEKRYFTDKEKKELNNRLEGIPGRKDNALKEYQKELDKIDDDELRIATRLAELEGGL